MGVRDSAVFWTLLLSVLHLQAVQSRRFNGFSRFQRGDQGPDDDTRINGATTEIHEVSVIPPIGGPNVCRTRERKFCCPGWSQRGLTGLCLTPICSRGCGSAGKCIKPNLCHCEGGKIGSKCDPGAGGVLGVDDGGDDLASGNNSNSNASGDGSLATENGGCRSTCLNGGTCREGSCVCRGGYAGHFCQEPVCKKECENGGRCIGPNRCACVYGYTGRYCEIDYRTGPCYRRIENDMCAGPLEGVVCTKHLCCATIGEAWGHPCEKCPATLACEPGFLKNVHTGKCMDINECEAIPGLCKGGECVNTLGSFSCTCPEGMAMNGNHECSDEDECSSPGGGDAICPHGRCVNRDPGYYCLCDAGFIPTQDQRACLDARQGNCYTSLSPGTQRCRNKIDFKLSRIDCCCGEAVGVAWGEGKTDCDPCPKRGSPNHDDLCKAALNVIDANGKNGCALRPDLCPNGKCVNHPAEGGYTCQCHEGFAAGPTGQSCQDIDECAKGFCQGGRCKNVAGSFECTCPPGFDVSADGKQCIDQNECEQTGVCANGRCINMDGSFKCECHDGYALSGSGLSCVDVDECLENPLVCLRGRCRNTKGGYVCECEPGFTHSADGAFCMDENECASQSHHVCQHGRCVNTEGAFRCVCDPGYELSANARTCVDIDECRSGPCQSGVCTNTEGSFKCECPVGFSLGPDGRTCSDSVQGLCYAAYREGQCVNPSVKMVSRSTCCCCSISFSHVMGWGTPCHACPSPGSQEFETLCPHGAGFTNGGDDINECAQDPNVCENGACENMLGNYRCICDPGYAVDGSGRRCLDVDECKNDLICKNGQCRNTPGSFQCVCPTGTAFNDVTNTCEDENECENNPDVCPNGRCVNTEGGYHCECGAGMALDASTKICTDNRRGSCWTSINSGNQCENNLRGLMLKSECCCSIGLAWGSPCETCDRSVDCKECPQGMAKIGGKNCQDINECSLDPTLCSGGVCINTEGSFTCRCPNGLTLNSAGTACIDERREPCYLDFRLGICTDDIGGLYKRDKCCCTMGEGWGFACSQCPRPGTKAFDELCPRGFGFVDQVDVNECLAFPDVCTNGRCKNSMGSFSCRCNQGYALDEHNVRCMNIDECSIMHGACGNGACVDLPGSFTCKCDPGFETTPLMQVCMDVNECQRDPGLCRGGRCINTPGSFHCECPIGLEVSEDGTSCKDIDECGLTSGVCSNGVCENMMGAYQCICDEGYEQAGSGTNCVDVDECANGNGGCDDICLNTPGSFTCACSSGYMLLLDGKRCKDIDECTEASNPCKGGKCINTPGSFSCVCSGGLMMGPDASSCLDLDECSMNKDICKNGKCENTVGSFKCLCDDGYSLKGEIEEGCTDDDECALDLYHCDQMATCKNTNGSYECVCGEGFTGDGFDCTDINECQKNNGGCDANARCVNSVGSFECICDDGFTGDGQKCADIDECTDDPTLCDNGVCLNDQGSFSCECQMGYMHPDPSDTQRCVDIDECSLLDNVCVNGVCENLRGIFKCVCDRGYTLDKTGGNCTDINECDDPQSCKYGNCINTEGSYICQCPRHFELLPAANGCVDRRTGICYTEVNTTQTGIHVCGGSLGEEVLRSSCCCSVGKAWGPECEKCPDEKTPEYKTICPGGSGFQPNPKTAILEDINECNEMNQMCLNGRCSNTFGHYMCTCDSGYTLNDDMTKCVDVNECEIISSACGQGQCVNTDGGFECVCPMEYVLSPDGRECIDMRKKTCFIGSTNSSGANCGHAMSRPQTRVVCCCSMGTAWGPQCDPCPTKDSSDYQELCGMGSPGMIVNPLTGDTQEIDECQLMPGMCQHGSCMNTVGSFRCDCDPGYIYDESSHQCIDRNECAMSNGGLGVCLGNARCVNTPGSFECICPEGYRLNHSGRDCLDIDECVERSPGVCQNGRCTNVAGGFQCVCNEGFTLTATRDACVDRDECSTNPFICGNGVCINNFGSFKCRCDRGFQLGLKGDCEDVDECRIRYDICKNGRCKNTKGGFTCQCTDGFTLSTDGQNCEDIDECKNKTVCPHPGKCQNTLGGHSCQCPKGYRLSDDQNLCVDIDECSEKPGFCADGICKNLDGGVACECRPGWNLSLDRSQCDDAREEPCYNEQRGRSCLAPRAQNQTRRNCCCTKGAAWGTNCESCPALNSKEFQKLCPLGPGRGAAGEDFDECVMMENLCEGGMCVNTDGSFRCECPRGYQLDSSGGKCVDENECLEKPRICGNGTCTNVDGGFECACTEGYAPGPFGICEDIDECTEYGHQCAFRCHNVPGSFRCVCPYGYTLAPDGRHCMDLNECESEANNCRYDCKNIIGTFMCVCPEGYRKKVGISDECEDIDECAANPDVCTGGGNCVNIPGGYICECKVGYELSPDGTSCLDRRLGSCSNKVIGGRCVQTSSGGVQRESKVTKADCCCTMGAGWTDGNGNGTCEVCPRRGTNDYDKLCMESGFSAQGQDIDECRALPNLCENGKCVNTLGSYRCICDRGYKPDSGLQNTRCLDVDECRQRPGPCEHECTNSYGSYTCSCPVGYVLSPDGRTCKDKDECATGDHNCQFECINTLGSFECVCPPGFSQLGDRCLDIDECIEQPGLCPPPGSCKNTHGSFKCVCPRGFKLDDSGTFCTDRDECEDTDKCNGAECKNIQGSYKCGCPDGFFLHIFTNECVDANECLDDSVNGACGNAKCQNTFGSFTCLCPAGYSYDIRLQICIQSAAGCSEAPCAFGCNPVGSTGFSCGCPRGYRPVGSGGHCMVLNSIEGFIGSDGDNYDDVNEGRDVSKNIVSTEGCFACNLNDVKDQKPSRPAVRVLQNTQRRLQTTPIPNPQQLSKLQNGRRRRHHHGQRQKRHLHKPALIGMTAILKSQHGLVNATSPQSKSDSGQFTPTKLTIRLTYDRTRAQRPIFFLQPALTDDIVTQHFLYILRGKDKHLFRLRKSSLDGAQELFYRHPVTLGDIHGDEVIHHLRIIGKPVNSTSDHQRSLDMKIKIVVLKSQP